MSSRSRSWIRSETVLAIHEAQIAEHGGSLGVRDVGLLESALARPQNADAYSEPRPDTPTLAALYAIGVIRNHPFIDGNKRVGFVLLELFLDLHGYALEALDADCLTAVMSLAAGTIDDAGFLDWVKTHAVARTRKAKPRK